MKTELTFTDRIKDALVSYCGNDCDSDFIANLINIAPDNDDFQNCLGELQREWDATPCDADGETKEQESYTNRLIDEAAAELIRIAEPKTEDEKTAYLGRRHCHVEKSASGYYRLIYENSIQGYPVHDDSACEDVYDEETAIDFFVEIVKSLRYEVCYATECENVADMMFSDLEQAKDFADEKFSVKTVWEDWGNCRPACFEVIDTWEHDEDKNEVYWTNRFVDDEM